MLRALAGAGLAMLPAACRAPSSEGIDFGLELYTVSAELMEDFDGTLEKVAGLGYREVEFPSLYGRSPGRIHRSLAAAGLNCESVHVAPSSLLDGMSSLEVDAAAVLGGCGELGVRYVVAGLPPMQPSRKPTAREIRRDLSGAISRYFESLTADDWKWIADFLNEHGEMARRFGLQLAYHNHSAEFRPLGAPDGPAGYDELLRLTDPALVAMELDCGWVTAANRDPLAYLRSHQGRFPLLHVKDVASTTTWNTMNRLDSAPVGEGIVDWQALLHTAQQGGAVYAYVEQEPPYEPSALGVARSSLDYLRKLKVK